MTLLPTYANSKSDFQFAIILFNIFSFKYLNKKYSQNMKKYIFHCSIFFALRERLNIFETVD